MEDEDDKEDLEVRIDGKGETNEHAVEYNAELEDADADDLREDGAMVVGTITQMGVRGCEGRLAGLFVAGIWAKGLWAMGSRNAGGLVIVSCAVAMDVWRCISHLPGARSVDSPCAVIPKAVIFAVPHRYAMSSTRKRAKMAHIATAGAHGCGRR